ncbi:hypothetical protein [Planctopirus hydrillae]|uniref:Uncharacterized protein n=1 Tax=Planctopirus hydrillae TaxID=1841610 RepID=A0A1C3E730_9PLAN|nr:hypothetical protein [Planctopirus hydrillae]ODA28969.1 hypothetical protein A6X21_10805 [Planctopirus hydrillae]
MIFPPEGVGSDTDPVEVLWDSPAEALQGQTVGKATLDKNILLLEVEQESYLSTGQIRIALHDVGQHLWQEDPFHIEPDWYSTARDKPAA